MMVKFILQEIYDKTYNDILYVVYLPYFYIIGHRNNVSENEISFSVTEGKDEQETTSDHNQQC